MMKLLQKPRKKLDKRRRANEFLTQLKGEEEDEFFDDVSAMRQATRESIQSQHEWHRREEFRLSTSGWGNVYEEGQSSSHGSVRGYRGERSISTNVSSVRSIDDDFYYDLLDKVIEEIGEECIIQIVTDNEAAMKVTGKRLMLKRTHLYWTSCATHCLDLCLEDMEKWSSVARVLEEAKKEFKESNWGQKKSRPAYEAKKIVLGEDFCKKATDIIKVYEPLVKVLRLVDSDEKPTMGFIYEAIDRAKRAIKENCRYSTKTKGSSTIDGTLCIPTCIQLVR
ncbi:hypothetical protein V6N12_007706 [Hibiscus sabdariffa]|uniref:DUF659 domain-containing protein n=1 Tax=Hibiscus sabdariffa TaxID=183260 RepID=A0ABR2F2J0_9ROSI